MTKSLNILMVTHHRRYRLRGRSLVMAEYMVKRGHKVTLVATANTRRFGISQTVSNGVRVIETPDLLWGKLRSGWDPWNMLNRESFLRKDLEEYDLVHTFETRPSCIYPSLSVSKRRKIPLITDWNDWFGRGGIISVLRPRWYQVLFGGIETYYEEAFRKRADGLTVISTALAERAVRLGISRENICYIPGGSIPETYPFRPMNDCRTHMGYPVDIPILGFSSGDSYLDMEIVLDTLAIIKQKQPKIHLIITGNVNNIILEEAQKKGVLDNLILPGFLPVKELSWCLGSANVFMLPFPPTIYNIGRWPNKLGLYMSQGKPTVTNPVGDVKPVFDQYSIGLMADNSAEDFADKTMTLLNDRSMNVSMGENALNLAQNQFNWSNLIKDLETYYYQILNGVKINNESSK
jgi:glycosyltransferase involved in cell wall biosynthesis